MHFLQSASCLFPNPPGEIHKTQCFTMRPVLNYTETSTKRCQVPDNLTSDGLKISLLKTAKGHKDDWGIEVAGCLECVNDSVAVETLNRLCFKIKFETGSHYSKTRDVSS